MKKNRIHFIAVFAVLLLAVSIFTATAENIPEGNATVYHVAQNTPGASDENPGNEKAPFLTIGKAAEIMLPGDTVIIHEGEYREKVSPANSGKRGAYITYRATPGEKVVIKGSELWSPEWVPEKYIFSPKNDESGSSDIFWQAELDADLFKGANFFALPNLIRNQYYPDYIEGMNLVRGCIFLNGQPIKQVVAPLNNDTITGIEGSIFWVEEDGMTVHLRLQNGENPNGKIFEITTREQVFAPNQDDIDYIAVAGLTLTQAANSLPSPGELRALIGSNGGKHWKITNCDISYANTVGLEQGSDWAKKYSGDRFSGSIIENNNVHDCDLSGLASDIKIISKRNTLAGVSRVALVIKTILVKEYKDYSWENFTVPDIPEGNVSILANEVVLPQGDYYVPWEKESAPKRIYHVAQNTPGASDSNDGSTEHPFLTISKAASVLKPGETVIVHEGVYRELIVPERGGTDAENMIWYRAAEGESVTVKGSDLWKPSFTEDGKSWTTTLSGDMFNGANVFCLQNTWMDKQWNCPGPYGGLFRGQIFLDGEQLLQVEDVSLMNILLKDKNVFCVDADGVTVHLRLADNSNPNGREFEITTRPQVFAPKERYQNYIGISGFTMLHAANSNPIPNPQEGLISANGGHHWIIEDCEIGYANTIGIDLGGQWWCYTTGEYQGYHIVRRNIIHNIGMCAIAAWHTKVNTAMLIEDNYLYNCCTMRDSHCESGAIKLHSAINSLIRRNVIANVWFGNAIWLDGESVNTRVTQNVCVVTHRTGWGNIMLEAYSGPYLVDNNIVSYMEGGDEK